MVPGYRLLLLNRLSLWDHGLLLSRLYLLNLLDPVVLLHLLNRLDLFAL